MAEKIETLVLAPHQVITDNRYPLASGQNLKRGRLLKLDSGKLMACNTGDTPHSILLEDCDATNGDTKCAYYIGGSFDETFIDYGDGTADDFREDLRKVGIYTFAPNK